MVKTLIFYIGTGLLFTHEMDAMARQEWLVLPLTAWLPESRAMTVFLLAHIPLFAVVTALIASRNEGVRSATRAGICLFLVIHGLLHLFFSSHAHYRFSGPVSDLLIFGGAAAGLFYLLLAARERQQKKRGRRIFRN